MSLRLVIVCFLALAAAGCGEDRRPNIILITADTLRADHIGCYGDSSAATATIDSLAAHGAMFEDASTTYPVTLPSHASMLTGRIPPAHGSRNNSIPPSLVAPFVPEQLQQSGYATAAVISAFVLDSRFGLDRGFQVYDDTLAAEHHGGDGAGAVDECRGAWTTDRALRWAENLQEPFFLWVHYFDPHAPYDPPPGYAPGYPGEVAYLDHELGRLLDGLRAHSQRDLGLIFAGDHGEGFGEHHEWTHGLLLYQATLRVPLVAVWPDGRHAGRSVTQPVSIVDIAPTVLEMAGVGGEFPAPALSLSRAHEQGDRLLFAETRVPWHNHGAAPLQAVRRGPWKMIDAPRPELYHVGEDPAEAENRATQQSERFDSLRRALTELVSRQDQPVAKASGDPEVRRRLAALGYLAGDHAGQEPDVAAGRTDPKDVAVALEAVRDGDRARARGESAAAAEHYRRALRLLPGEWKASWKLAQLLASAGDLEAAGEVYEAALRQDPANITAVFHRATLHLARGELTSALAGFDRVLARVPDHVEALFFRAQARWRNANLAGAREDLGKILALDPDHSDAQRLRDRIGPPRQ